MLFTYFKSFKFSSGILYTHQCYQFKILEELFSAELLVLQPFTYRAEAFTTFFLNFLREGRLIEAMELNKQDTVSMELWPLGQNTWQNIYRAVATHAVRFRKRSW